MQSKIEQQVMAGVRVVYMARQLVSATALKLYVCALSLYGLGRLVWVSHVFENWSHVGLQGTLQFVASAVLNTHLPVQIALLILTVAALSLIRDLARTLTAPRLRLA